MKILLSGASGSGKTTMARHISDNFDIPFVQGSTKPLWPEFKINSHQELVKRTVSDIDWGLAFQYACLEYREEQFSRYEHLVSDRGFLDNIVYFMMQVSPFVDSKVTKEYIERAKLISDKYDNLNLLLRLPNENEFENDGMRVNNFEYQMMTHILMKKLSSRYNISNHYIDVWELKKRKNMINHIIQLYGKIK